MGKGDKPFPVPAYYPSEVTSSEIRYPDRSVEAPNNATMIYLEREVGGDNNLHIPCLNIGLGSNESGPLSQPHPLPLGGNINLSLQAREERRSIHTHFETPLKRCFSSDHRSHNHNDLSPQRNIINQTGLNSPVKVSSHTPNLTNHRHFKSARNKVVPEICDIMALLVLMIRAAIYSKFKRKPVTARPPKERRTKTFPSFPGTAAHLARVLGLLFVISSSTPTQAQSRPPSVKMINLTYALIQDEGKPCFPMDSCERPDVKLFPERAERRLRNCECDDDCSLYGDCCIDSKTGNNDSISPAVPATKANWSCNYVSGLYHVYLINSCPLNHGRRYDAVLVQKCQNPDLSNPSDFIPYTDVRTNYSYANVYCAVCNIMAPDGGVDDRMRSLVPWTSTIACDFKVGDMSTDNFIANHLNSPALRPRLRHDDYRKFLIWTDLLTPDGQNSGKCWWKFAHPAQETTSERGDNNNHGGIGVRKCVPDVISDCSVVHTNQITNTDKRATPPLIIGNDLKAKCKSYTARVWTATRRVYKNSHCALCNGERAEDISCYDIFSQPLPIHDARYYYNQARNVQSQFRVKMNLHTMSDGNVADPLRNCRPGNFWDPFQAQCANLHYCVPGTGYVAANIGGSSCQIILASPSPRHVPHTTPHTLTSSRTQAQTDVLNMYGTLIPCLSQTERINFLADSKGDAFSHLPVVVLSPKSYHLIGDTGVLPPVISVHISNDYYDTEWHGLILNLSQVYFANLKPQFSLNAQLMSKPTLYVCRDTLYNEILAETVFPDGTGNNVSTEFSDHAPGPFNGDAWSYTCKRKRIVSYLALVVSAAVYIFYAIISLCRMLRRPRQFFKDASSMLILVHVLECAALNGLLIYALFYYNSFTLPPPPSPSPAFQHHTNPFLATAPSTTITSNGLQQDVPRNHFLSPTTDRCRESYYMSEHVGLLIKSRLSVNIIQPLLVFLIFSCLFWVLSYAVHRFFHRFITASYHPNTPDKRHNYGDGDSMDKLKQGGLGGESIMSGSTVIQRISGSRPFISFIIFQCSSWCMAFLMTALFYLTATLSLNRNQLGGRGLGYFFALNRNKMDLAPTSRLAKRAQSLATLNETQEVGMWESPPALGPISCSCSCLPPVNRFFGLSYLLPVNLITSLLASVLITWAILLTMKRFKGGDGNAVDNPEPTLVHHHQRSNDRTPGSSSSPSPPLYDVRRNNGPTAYVNNHTRGGKFTGRAGEEDKGSSSSSSGGCGAQSSCSATDDSLLHHKTNSDGNNSYEQGGFATKNGTFPISKLIFPEIHGLLLILLTFTQFVLLSAAAANAFKVVDRSCSLYWIFFVVLGNFKAIIVCGSRYGRGKFRVRDKLAKTFRSISPIAGKGDPSGYPIKSGAVSHVKYTYNPLATTGYYDVSGVRGGDTIPNYPTFMRSPKYSNDGSPAHNVSAVSVHKNNDKFMELALEEDKARLHSVKDIEVV